MKRGSGAFLPELDRVLELADVMIKLGADHGCPVVALVTAMDRPLGRACGNALEVEEAIAALKGEGPPDLMSVTYALGAEMLVLAGAAADIDAARARDGEGDRHRTRRRAFSEDHRGAGRQSGRRRRSRGAAAGGGVRDLRRAASRIRRARRAARDRPRHHRAGRRANAVEDDADPSVGFVITARPGDWVEAGEPLATIFARDRAGIGSGRQALRAAIVIADEAEPPLPLVSHRVTAARSGALPERVSEKVQSGPEQTPARELRGRRRVESFRLHHAVTVRKRCPRKSPGWPVLARLAPCARSSPCSPISRISPGRRTATGGIMPVLSGVT